MATAFHLLDLTLNDSVRIDAATLDRLVADHPPRAALLRHLVALMESGEAMTQIAASALLKRYQANGALFSHQIIGCLVDLLPSASHWEVTLHLLQMLSRLPIPPSHMEQLCDSARHLSLHRNAFVRAWAYSALHHLAMLYPQYRSDVSPLLERASNVEAPSVRARLRQLPSLDNILPNA